MRHSALASKPPPGEHHRPGRDDHRASFAPDDDAGHAAVVVLEFERAASIPDVDSMMRRARVQRVDQPRPAAPGLDREPAPELEAAVDLEGLPPVNRHEAHALGAHPDHGLEAAAHQQFCQFRVGAVLRDARQVIEELVLGVGAEIGARLVLVGEVGHQAREVVDAVVGDAHRARGEAAVAAAFGLGRAFQHQHADA